MSITKASSLIFKR